MAGLVTKSEKRSAHVILENHVRVAIYLLVVSRDRLKVVLGVRMSKVRIVLCLKEALT